MKIKTLFESAINQTYPEGDSDIILQFLDDNDDGTECPMPDHSARAWACDPFTITACSFQGDAVTVSMTKDDAASPKETIETFNTPYPVIVVWKASGPYNLRLYQG